MILVVLVLVIHSAVGHFRWNCPLPRTDWSAEHTFPCSSSDFNSTYSVLHPGFVAITIAEAAYHEGTNFRISLSQHREDTLGCIILDHIPHDDSTADIRLDEEETFRTYRISVKIPDFNCERCSLQLAAVVPAFDQVCFNPGEPACPGTFYSCANVKILGSKPMPLTQSDCPTLAWPYDDLPNNQYKHSSGIWVDSWLMDVPETYRLDSGPCAPYDPSLADSLQLNWGDGSIQAPVQIQNPPDDITFYMTCQAVQRSIAIALKLPLIV